MCRGEQEAGEGGGAAGGRAGRGERGSGRSERGANCTRRCPERSARRSNVACPPRQGQNRHCACPADFKPSPETGALATAHARGEGGSGSRECSPARRPAGRPGLGLGPGPPGLPEPPNGPGWKWSSLLLEQTHPRARGRPLHPGQFPNISSEGGSTASLGSPFQCLVTQAEKRLFLMFR